MDDVDVVGSGTGVDDEGGGNVDDEAKNAESGAECPWPFVAW